MVGVGVCEISLKGGSMNTLDKIIEACARSDFQVKLYQNYYNAGMATEKSSVKLIQEEITYLKKQIDKIIEDDFMNDRKLEDSYGQV